MNYNLNKSKSFYPLLDPLGRYYQPVFCIWFSGSSHSNLAFFVRTIALNQNSKHGNKRKIDRCTVLVLRGEGFQENKRNYGQRTIIRKIYSSHSKAIFKLTVCHFLIVSQFDTANQFHNRWYLFLYNSNGQVGR